MLAKLSECSNITPSEVLQPLAYTSVCGSAGGVREVFRLRPLWGAFLAVKNTLDEPVTLEGLHALSQGESCDSLLRVGEPESGRSREHRLPESPVPPGNSVIIPVQTIFGSLGKSRFTSLSARHEDLPQRQVQKLSFGSFDNETVQVCRTWGPCLYPQSLRYQHNGREDTEAVHTLDLKNTYTLDRFWEAGSCPHVFFQLSDGGLWYWGECFARKPCSVQTERIEIPDGVVAVVLAELEHETTYIRAAHLNGSEKRVTDVLTKGESLRIDVSSGDTIVLKGKYIPDRGSSVSRRPWTRNKLVEDYIAYRST